MNQLKKNIKVSLAKVLVQYWISIGVDFNSFGYTPEKALEELNKGIENE